MNPSDDTVARLARRLKELREGGLAGQRITQRQLGDALNASTPLISSWESTTNPKIPPLARLESYATFFATARSVTGKKYRLLRASELSSEERAKRDELLRSLTSLRDDAESPPTSAPDALGGLWRFPADQDVTIICAELPDARKQMSYADPNNPDFIRAYRYSDLDALIELYGHIRAANPMSRVDIRSSGDPVQDFTAHLVVLGGVDWNPVTAQLLHQLALPVQQIKRDNDADVGGFMVVGEEKVFRPEVSGEADSLRLVSDIMHFYRGPNPFNRERTLTICNGMYARGVLGAVTALTDRRMRDRNESYARERFGDGSEFSILAKVIVVNEEVVPPDWTSPDTHLHEWWCQDIPP